MDWLSVYDAHTVGGGRLDPSSPEAAHRRLSKVAASLPVDVEDAQWVESSVNNVWRIGDMYLRLSFRGDRSRLRREATLLDALPASIPHIGIVDVGEAEDMEWMLSRATPGSNLATIAGELPQEDLRAVTVELGRILRELHRWEPPAAVADALREKQATVDSADALGIVATDLVPVPLRRAFKLIEPMRTLPHIDPGLLDAAVDRLRELAPNAPDPSEYAHVIHGDAGASNVLVDGGRITAVIDFEFARLAPPDLELISFVRGLDAQRVLFGGAPPVLEWLQEGYPELFAHPNLSKRLWLYGIAFALETILFWPPEHPETGPLHPAHPLRALRRLVDAPY